LNGLMIAVTSFIAFFPVKKGLPPEAAPCLD
jgi:hypothetical protein